MVHASHGLDRIASQNQGPKPFQAVRRQFASSELADLAIDGRGHPIDQRSVPSDEQTGAGGMLRLSDQIGGDVFRIRAVIRQHDHFTRAGQHVNGHLAEYLPLSQGDKQVPRPDDHVDRGNAFDAIGQGGHRLSAAHPVHFVDSQLAAGRQQITVVSALGCGWNHHGNFRHGGGLGRANGHQHRGRICGRSSRNANSHPTNRAIAQAQLMAAGHAQDRIPMQ